MSVHTHLHDRRLQLGFTLAVIAERLKLMGMKNATKELVWKLEHGREIKADEVPLLAEALECSVLDLVDPAPPHDPFPPATAKVSARGFAPTQRAAELQARIRDVVGRLDIGAAPTVEQQLDAVRSAVVAGDLSAVDAIPLLRKLMRSPGRHHRRGTAIGEE